MVKQCGRQQAPLSTQPLGIRAVDWQLKKFVGNLLDYSVDPDYFWLYAIAQIYYGTVQYFTCSWGFTSGAGVYDSYVGGFDSINCDTYYVFVSGAYLDFSVYSGPAVSIWAHANDLEEGTETAAQSTEASQEEAEDVFQVQIGGWPMEEVLGPEGEHTDPDIRRALETFWAILGIGRANAQEIQTDEAPPQSPRLPDHIYLTGRIVAGGESRHAALEYLGLPAFYTLSSYNANAQVSHPTWGQKKMGHVGQERELGERLTSTHDDFRYHNPAWADVEQRLLAAAAVGFLELR
jgi:hypothetical protein